MPLDRDLNIPPYFDDFNEDSKYYRYLYRPSVAVQARELTGTQTMLQNQIERFGNHIFKDGSIVDGVGITYYPNVHYISVEDYFTTNTSLNVTDLDSTYLLTNSTDSNNTVRAVIKIAKLGTKENHPATNRFYLDYISTGTNGANDVSQFAEGDTIYVYSPVQGKFNTLDANNLVDTIDTLTTNGTFTANGYAYCIGVSDGIIFQKGFFLKVEPQVITCRDYSTNVTGYVVGFNTVEDIIDEYDDTTLFDNALGYSNENAPGAHRLELTPSLVCKEKTDAANNIQFFSIVEFDGQSPTQQNDDPTYAAIGKAIADRTYEESGDYVVKPFNIETRNNDANSSTFFYEISPGIAYVRGNRIEKIGPTKVESPRGITTAYAENQIITANYGNYVIVDELVGQFDTEKMSEVVLYNGWLRSISDAEGISASLSAGTIVGYANVRAVEFYSGTKNNAKCQYLLYLFNIRMNSTYSFSDDVKSIYVTSGGTFGAARADIVTDDGLVTGKAVLRESTRSSLVFDTGMNAVKVLAGNTGIGDSSFVYTQIKAGTIDANGAIALTIDSAASGGTERLNASSGAVLVGNDLDEYYFTLTANAYSANLGSIAFSSGNTVITGTNFLTTLSTNTLIRISANSTTNHIRRVVTIANNTSATIDATISTTNAASVFQSFYIDGSILPIETITINSNTSFTAELGVNLDSGSQSVYAAYPISRTSAVAIPKVVSKNRFVKIDCSNNAGGITGPWNLGFVDVHKLRHVYIGTTYEDTNTDRLDWFTLDTGQRDEFYDHAKLVINPKYRSKIDANSRFLVELDYFTANTSTSVGFFSVESYPIDDANTANTTAITTIELPLYDGKELRNCVDFRPRKFNTSNTSATSNTGATVNPEASNTSFDIAAGGHYLIAPDNNFTADFEFYLPRIDLVVIDSTGRFGVVRGIASPSPRKPFVENDQSIFAEVYVPAYPTATKREFDTYKTGQFTKINLKTNRRYTMKDIGVIDERVKRIEYYTVLNTLEQQARDLTVSDSNGLDRFKNGIFADPFNSHNIGNVSDFEYKISIDPKETVARPFIQRHDIDMMYMAATSNNITKTGPILTLPYSPELYISQNYATKYRNVCESVWQWNGRLQLYPSFDFFRDEDTSPNVNVNIDIAAPWEQFANSPWGSRYGDWRTTNSSTAVDTNVTTNGPFTTSTTTTTTTTTQEATVDQLTVDTITSTIDLGSYVKDFSVQPYMRSRLVAFVTYNMKPNTTLHAFFDDVNVDAHCAPGTIDPGMLYSENDAADSLQHTVVTQTGAFGDPLVSDSTGAVYGIFRIPAETFRTGDRMFQLTNVDDLVTGADAKITVGKARYTADNVSVTRGSTTISVREPTIGTSSTTNRRTSVDVDVDVTTIWVDDGPGPSDGGPQGDGGGGADPLTQSFFVENVPDTVSGVFISQVGLFFQSKDSTLGCSVFLCEMDSNFPNSEKIIGKAYMPASDITVSTDASSETIFVFEYPVYMLTNNQYAYIIQPDGNSPEYTVWVGETGGYDVATDAQVFSNPYSGLMFVSANRQTWTAIQKEDVKFKLYRARFTANTGYAIFNNENDEYFTIDGFVKANASVGVEVGDVVYTVNATPNTALTANTFPYGRVQYINTTTGELWLDSSRGIGGFSNTTNPHIRFYRPADIANLSLITATNHIASANILSVNDLTYHAVVPKFGVLQPKRTTITYDFKGTSTSNVIDAAYVNVDNNTEYEFTDVERHVKSRSNEVTGLSNTKSGAYKLSLTTTSDFVSPVIDLDKKATLFIENLINDDVTDEHTRYGNTISKYVGKKVVLKDGQEAEDIKVYVTAYKPNETNVAVYIKFKNHEDTETFNDKVWTKLQYDNGGEFVYSTPGDSKDYREFEFSVPSVNAVAYGAFSNIGTTDITTLTGVVTIANNSNVIEGTGTAFDTETAVGEQIKVVSNDYFAIRTVTSIANATYMTVDDGLAAANTAALSYVYASGGNDGIVEYKSSSGSRYIGFKEFAVKILLLSSNPVVVPKLNDVRVLALQI